MQPAGRDNFPDNRRGRSKAQKSMGKSTRDEIPGSDDLPNSAASALPLPGTGSARGLLQHPSHEHLVDVVFPHSVPLMPHALLPESSLSEERERPPVNGKDARLQFPELL